MKDKILGSPVTAVVSIVMIAWGAVEFYQFVLVPQARRFTGGM